MRSPPLPSPPAFEHHHDGLGVGYTQPRLSWSFLSHDNTASAWRQTAYEVEITQIPTAQRRSFRIESTETTLVPWPGMPLRSREAASVRVRSFGRSIEAFATDDSQPTKWSPPSRVEVGLLKKEEWSAHFITPSQRIGPEAPLQPVRFQKAFDLPQGIGSFLGSRLYITALGVFEAYVNGHRTSNEFMAPGWTSYNHRLSYRTHDVSQFLKPGANTICVEVGEGWYAGQLGIQGGGRFLYGGQDLGILAQLEVHNERGTDPVIIGSDETWQAMPSAISSSEIYNGEVYEQGQEFSEWPRSFPLDSKVTQSCRRLPWITGQLVAPDAAPVRVVEKRHPIDVFRSKSGNIILDFGQNLVGKLQVSEEQLQKGHQLIFKHAEVMEHGNLGTRPLRSARCTDILISSGAPIRDWSPKFTYHGFRYVQVEGLPECREEDLLQGKRTGIAALVMQSDLRRRGHFECSNSWLNQLHSNIRWSMRGNFFSIPTDCPQRAERLGWTGDINQFCPTASFLYDTTGFLSDWLQDLSAEHLEESRKGIPPLVCPDLLWTSLFPEIPQAIWDDATVLVPWSLFQYTNDKAILNRQFASMQSWLTQGLPRGSDGLWAQCWQFGDWLDPTAPPHDPAASRTDGILVADAFLIHTTEKMAEICAILSKETLALQYKADAARLKQAFQHKYISRHGNLMSNSQTGLSLAIHFGLYENDAQVELAAASLERLVKAAKFHISTGFAGTPVITHALTKVGKSQIAYRMILEKTCPSWLYPITMGATTMWERWDSMLPDGSINPGAMTSFNHYALGAVADWLHGVVAGISPLEPGWRKIQVRPKPGGNVTSASATFDGPHGLVKCSWHIENACDFKLSLVVPPNSEAVVTLPTEPQELPVVVHSGSHEFSCKIDLGDWPPAKFIPPFLPKPTEETIAV